MPRTRILIGLAVSAVFLALLLRQVERGELADAVREAQPGWLLAAAAPYALALWLRAARWRRLLRAALRLSHADALSLVVIGYAANNLLPVRAGEMVRAGLLRQRHGAAWSLGLGTIVVERVLDGLVLAAFLAVAVALAGGSALLALIALFAGAGFVALTLLLALLGARPERGAALVGALLRRLPPRPRGLLGGWLAEFLAGLTTLRGPGAWAGATALTVASWACEGTAYWLVALGFGLELSPLLFAGVVGAANLALVAPSTAGGIGPFEFFVVEVVTAHGVAQGAATAYALALHALLLAPVALAGLALLWHRHLGLHALVPVAAPPAARAAASVQERATVEVPAGRRE